MLDLMRRKRRHGLQPPWSIRLEASEGLDPLVEMRGYKHCKNYSLSTLSALSFKLLPKILTYQIPKLHGV